MGQLLQLVEGKLVPPRESCIQQAALTYAARRTSDSNPLVVQMILLMALEPIPL